MCLDPATLAALTLAASAGQAVMAHQSADAQADAQDAQNELTKNILAQEESLTQMDLARQRQQEAENAAAEANAYASQARKDQGELDAILGEGFAGNTAGRKVAAMGIKQGQDVATLTSNSNRVQAELGFATSAASNAKNQKVASLRPGERPSLLGTALTIGGAGLQYGSSMNKINGKVK